MGWVVALENFNPYNPTQPTYEKLMEHLMDYCDENLMECSNDTECLEKIKNQVNNYVNPYIICDD